MPNHAVLGVWTIYLHRYDPVVDDRQLTTEVVPRVSAVPGFVEGRWNRSPDGSRAYSYIVFHDLPTAEQFLGFVRSDMSGAAAAGVHLHSLEILDVVATA